LPGQGIDGVERPPPPQLKDRINRRPLHVAINHDGNGRGRGPGSCRARRAIAGASRPCPPASFARNELGILVYLTIFSFELLKLVSPRRNRRLFRPARAASPQRSGDPCIATAVLGAGSANATDWSRDICALLNEAEELTRGNTKLHLVVCSTLRIAAEIAHRRRGWRARVAEGRRDPHVYRRRRAWSISRMRREFPNLGSDHSHQRRTAGLSNFLMWQAAY